MYQFKTIAHEFVGRQGWADLSGGSHMITVRCHLGLLLSEGSTNLDIQDARSMAGNQCWLSAASTAGPLLGVLTRPLQLSSLMVGLLTLQFRTPKESQLTGEAERLSRIDAQKSFSHFHCILLITSESQDCHVLRAEN